MSVEAASAPSTRSGLSTLWDVIVAPQSAFAALRERPTWVWAFVATSVFGIAGALLQLPAGEHIARNLIALNPSHDPKIAAMTPEQRQAVTNISVATQRIATWLYPIGVLVAIAWGTLIALIANAAGKGDGTWGRLFAFIANIAFIRLGLGAFVTGVLVALRGPAALVTTRDLLTVLPSLAWLVPAGNVKLAAFLAVFNPFQIWTFVLIGIGLPIFARIGRTPAFVAAAVIVLTETAISVASAK
ncbi:MAG: YIP1 family protein [Candidatus Eremiobacteraeota bacterium]|nr:YIP1 family protein [Candidatus Eremiobacteraeota bacterium]MBC5802019.1 YIP1 family protein [Candidatus Eremiobacteraeota bacterium]MBC5822577.1 YIP1 family protein [Candidatus Eremiobacteraeota bacterium]